MKVLEINSVSGIRSTGRICTDIADVLHEFGDECTVAYGREDAPEKYRGISHRIGGDLGVKIHALASRFFDTAGFHSSHATKKLLRYIDEYAPDVIHLHNIHGYYLNVELLFDYIKKKDIPTVWTLHDCWAFTGHCSHYSAAGCDRWISGCYGCPQKGEYPKSIFLDGSKRNYERKKRAFLGVKNMTLVTPSEWLAGEVRKSFLGEYRVEVINNGIDLEVFKPRPSDFRARYGLENKKIVLGVATAWGERKGLSRFAALADMLGEEYKVVLVGLKFEEIAALPEGVLGIARTNSPTELAEIYSAADVCVSLSTEETMGLTVVEANACGTPAAVLDKTALPELIDGRNGIVFKESSLDGIAAAIRSQDFSAFSAEDCINAAKKYEKTEKYAEYITLYKEMLK